MPYVTSRDFLRGAAKNGWAVGAFNAENAEMTAAVIAAAESRQTPVIIQTTPSTLKHLPPACFVGLVRAMAETASVPVALHLDHGSSFALAKECILCGYSSVMIDCSGLEFEENVRQTAAVVEFAEQYGVPVEAELGRIGGKEDSTQAQSGAYTDPSEAAEFVRRTGVSSLAVALGTAHGVYTKAPVLDLERAALIRAKIEVPLVLHGASGLADAVIRTAVQKGIAKINFATELRMAFSEALRQYIALHPADYDPKTYLRAAQKAVECTAAHKLSLLKP